MLVASYPFSVRAATAALRMAGSRDRSSRPVVRWRSFDSVSRISFDPVGYMPCHVDCSADCAVWVHTEVCWGSGAVAASGSRSFLPDWRKVFSGHQNHRPNAAAIDGVM